MYWMMELQVYHVTDPQTLRKKKPEVNIIKIYSIDKMHQRAHPLLVFCLPDLKDITKNNDLDEQTSTLFSAHKDADAAELSAGSDGIPV